MSQTFGIVSLILCALFMTIAQAMWKVAAPQMDLNNGVMGLLLKLVTNFNFIAGCGLYVLATVSWIFLLGQYDYSKIYPAFIGVCLIVSLIIGTFFFEETTGVALKIIGSSFILCGLLIITKS